MNVIYPWQKEVWRKLALDTKRNARGVTASSAHALLLRGRKGLGKLAFGVFLAKSRLCENISDEGEACGICSSCRWFEQGSHPDFRLIKPLALSNLSTISGSERNGSDGDGASRHHHVHCILSVRAAAWRRVELNYNAMLQYFANACACGTWRACRS